MDTQKNIPSLTTIPNQSKLQTQPIPVKLTHFINPYQPTYPSKFTKGKRQIKTTIMNSFTQTSPNPEKLSIKTFNHANTSTIYNPPTYRPISKPGLFYQTLSKQTTEMVKTMRSFQDIGAMSNRKGTHGRFKPDPILFGDDTANKFNSSLQKVWNEPRKHRDNGIECSKTLQWDTTKKVNKYL